MSTRESAPDHTSFDDALHLITSPVTIVGVAHEGRTAGLTAAWVTRVSMEPPLLLVSIGHARHTWSLASRARHFTVSVLAAGQVETARLFGLKSGRDLDKWGCLEPVLMGPGVPAIPGCSARFLCTVQDRFTTGDHDCLVGIIEEAVVDQGAPVLPMRGTDYAAAPPRGPEKG